MQRHDCGGARRVLPQRLLTLQGVLDEVVHCAKGSVNVHQGADDLGGAAREDQQWEQRVVGVHDALRDHELVPCVRRRLQASHTRGTHMRALPWHRIRLSSRALITGKPSERALRLSILQNHERSIRDRIRVGLCIGLRFRLELRARRNPNHNPMQESEAQCGRSSLSGQAIVRPRCTAV